ncbi:MAG: hypothetical protein ABIE42_08950 [Candidatus Eisenbacteria bacterium]
MLCIVQAISPTNTTATAALTGLLSIGHEVQLRLSTGLLSTDRLSTS